MENMEANTVGRLTADGMRIIEAKCDLVSGGAEFENAEAHNRALFARYRECAEQLLEGREISDEERLCVSSAHGAVSDILAFYDEAT